MALRVVTIRHRSIRGDFLQARHHAPHLHVGLVQRVVSDARFEVAVVDVEQVRRDSIGDDPTRDECAEQPETA
jgi:hypothetical protein